MTRRQIPLVNDTKCSINVASKQRKKGYSSHHGKTTKRLYSGNWHSSINNMRFCHFAQRYGRSIQLADDCLPCWGAPRSQKLLTVGLPAVFQPLPHAVDDHQTANAKTLFQKNMAPRFNAAKELTAESSKCYFSQARPSSSDGRKACEFNKPNATQLDARCHFIPVKPF